MSRGKARKKRVSTYAEGTPPSLNQAYLREENFFGYSAQEAASFASDPELAEVAKEILTTYAGPKYLMGKSRVDKSYIGR